MTSKDINQDILEGLETYRESLKKQKEYLEQRLAENAGATARTDLAIRRLREEIGESP